MNQSITLQARNKQISSSKYADAVASQMVCLPLDIKIAQYSKSEVNTLRFKFNKSSETTKHINHMITEGLAESQTQKIASGKKVTESKAIKSRKILAPNPLTFFAPLSCSELKQPPQKQQIQGLNKLHPGNIIRAKKDVCCQASVSLCSQL